MRPGLLVLILAGTLLLAACAPTSRPPSPAADARQKVAAHLRAERFEAALAVIREERREKGSNRLLEVEYLQVLQALASAGEKHFKGGEYQQAGKAFRTLLDHFPRGRAFAPSLLVSRETVEKLLQACADRLMDGGLTEYRAGNLQRAIDIWKEILVFYPTHDGAKKAIHTADIQLKNLRSLP
jgi:TolA-binding protein